MSRYRDSTLEHFLAYYSYKLNYLDVEASLMPTSSHRSSPSLIVVMRSVSQIKKADFNFIHVQSGENSRQLQLDCGVVCKPQEQDGQERRRPGPNKQDVHKVGGVQ